MLSSDSRNWTLINSYPRSKKWISCPTKVCAVIISFNQLNNDTYHLSCYWQLKPAHRPCLAAIFWQAQRHLRKDRLIYGSHHLPCLSHQYCQWPLQKIRRFLGRCDASSGHTTKLKQSIFFRYLWVDCLSTLPGCFVLVIDI